jgi:site-specific DNA recombinase
LPYVTINLAEAPEEQLRRLFEIMRLTVHLIDDSDEIRITIQLPADELPQIAHQAETTTQAMPSTHKAPAQRVGSSCADAVVDLGDCPGNGVFGPTRRAEVRRDGHCE